MAAVASPESTLCPPLRVGEWLVDPSRLLLQGSNTELSLEPRVMELLIYMAERPREVISAEQLLIDIWHGPFYGDGPVQRAMAILRRSLGDDSQSPRYIETIRKRGYRLIADVIMPSKYAAFSSDAGKAWQGGSPFVGLRPFDAMHSAVFFGRARSTALLLAAIRKQQQEGGRLVLMLGPSGCGKTSLLRAGVLPLLQRDEGFDGLRVAAACTADFAEAQPGALLGVLAAALCTWHLRGRPVFVDRADVEVQLRSAPDELVAGIESAYLRSPSRGHGGEPFLLLTIDHAEAALADGLADCRLLNTALSALCASPRVLVVMLCRSDFYPSLLERLPEIAQLKTPDGHFDLLPPSPGELAEVIRRPALAAGLAFEKDPDTALGLDDVLRDAAVAHPEALPMLQYTLQALYEARGEGYLLSFAAYHRLGGLGGALALRAEQLFQEVPETVRAAWVSLLERLVVSHESNQALTARRIPWSALQSDAERDLVGRLVDARLFTSALSDDVAQFSVTHETLLRAWPRVQDWARDNQRQLQAQRRVKHATIRWLQADRRADLLLNHGLPLIEARDLVQHAPRLLDANDHALVQASESADRRRRTRRVLAFAAAVVLAAASAISALLALRAHQDAERRRSQAESLVDYLLTDLADELRPLGRLALMDHVAQRALAHLSQLPERDADETTRLQRVRALRTLGEVFVERGDQGAAQKAFDQAITMLQGTTAGADISSDVLLERGTVAYWLGMLDFRRNDLAAAETWFERYRTDATELTRRAPENADWQLELSYALNNLGSVAKQQQQSERALELFRQSAELKDRVLAAQPNNTALAVEQADSLSWIGSVLEQEGRLGEAMGYYQRQLELLRGIGERQPAADGWRHRLALAELMAGKLHVALDRLNDASQLYSSAEQSLEHLIAADVSNATWQRNLSYAQVQIGYLLVISQRPDEARLRLLPALERMQRLVSDPESPTEWRRLFALNLLRMGQAELGRHALDDAQSNLDRALGETRALFVMNPGDNETRDLLARVWIARGDVLATRKKHTDAQAAWHEARTLLALIAPESRNRHILQSWIAVHQRLDRSQEVSRERTRLYDGGYRLGESVLP